MQLNYYHHLLGIRAILWSQGESDTFINKSAQEYANDLKLVISETRKSSAKNIAWVVSRTSKVGNRTSPDVIQGQNTVKGIGYNMPQHIDLIKSGKPFDLVFQLQLNEWQGTQTVQMQVIDIKASA